MPMSCWQNQQVKQEAHPEAVAFHPVTPVLLAGLNLLDRLDRHQMAANQVKVQTIPIHSCCHQLILCLGPGHLRW